MKKIDILLLVCMSIFLCSCDDYVDITPKGSAVAETMDDIDQLLSYGSELSTFSNSIPNLVNDNIKILTGDVAELESNPQDRRLAGIYKLDPIFHMSHEVDYEWLHYYSAISVSNYVLALLDQIQGEQSIKDQYRGEALTHRAYFYFRLVNVYGHHYGLSIANEDGSGVPIILKYADQTESLQRKSVNEVYELMVSDLNTAIPLLNDGRQYRDRVNKSAAQALMSRIYLHMGNEAKALEFANTALAANSNLVDYSALESEVDFPLDNVESLLTKESQLLTVGSYPNRHGMGTFSDDLVSIYDDIVNDCRISKIPGRDNEDNYVYGYESYYSYRYSTGVNVPELLLIKAEVLARDNKVTEAMDVVNTLRAKRFDATAVSNNLHLLSASNQADAIQKVIDERRREFHVSGMRFFDIKRLNALYNAGISLSRGAVTWSPNSINWAAPIGISDIESSNGQIQQNPRE